MTAARNLSLLGASDKDSNQESLSTGKESEKKRDIKSKVKDIQ
jgi:hypothetical protein